jgi:PKD repeat protein
MAIFKSRFAGGTGRGGGGVAPRDFHGLDVLKFKVNIPTTALDSNDEQILLYKFPDDGDCWMLLGGNSLDTDDAVGAVGADFHVKVSNIDAGGTASAVWDFGLGDIDGVIDTALISSSTVGQGTAGTDYVDTIVNPIDVSGKYLIFDVTAAAASAVAGDIEVFAKVLFGKKLEVDSGVS